MKRILLAILAVASLISCEDVIEVETPNEPPRLIVDGVIRIDTSQSQTTAIIKLYTSSSFFEGISPASADFIMIQNSEYESRGPLDQNFILLDDDQPGIYTGTKNTTFFTEGSLDLYVNFEGKNYYATTSFVPTSPIESLVQGEETLFTGDETEIIISFTDDGTRDDFYIFDFGFNEFLVTEDEFYQGQRFEFSYFYEDIQPGQEMTISILGADESFYNYMNQIIVQAGGDQGPFQTPAATVRGNVFNVTGIDNVEIFDNVERSNSFALGYFAVVQEFKRTIEIE